MKDYPNYWNNDTLAEKQKLTIIEINKTIMEWKRKKVSIYAQDRASLKASSVGIGAPESKDLPAFLLCLQEELDL